MRSWILILTITGTLFVLMSCGRSPAQPSPATAPAATQPTGPRIASTVPAATRNLVLIGAADRLVGVSQFDTLHLPEAQRDLPVIGDYEHLNYERLVALHPTVLIMQMAEARLPQKLKDFAAAQHIEIVNVKLESTDDLWTMVKTLGRVSEHEADADAAIARSQRELTDISDQYKNQKHPRVVYVVDEPLRIAGGETILNEIITMAGGENVGAQAGSNFPVISMETLVKLNPDVLLIGAPDQRAQRADDPRLDTWMRMNIPAVRNKRVFLVTDGDILTASLQLPKNVRMLANLIHKGEPQSPSTIPAAPSQETQP